MENDLISRSTFRQQLIDRQITTNFFNPEKREEDGCIIDLLDKAPAADVAPVRHGRWIEYDGDSWKCSICGEENCYAYDRNVNRFTDNYCPKCGARMDGGADQ